MLVLQAGVRDDRFHAAALLWRVPSAPEKVDEVTRPLTKSVPFFPDWHRTLSRAERVRTVPLERECHLCGSKESALVEMLNTDGWRCESNDACGRRLAKRG